ncbi:YheC/YheD family protein [Cohnella faecalis]|uniref:YheC/YheD family protein n=1 Tax=Cohnella faecalis TaxID=2315694 RepID=A0A398CQV5_9BACL|nr:YheC/YheD family protein [Cohnella faecalis]RIE04935.1 YheC/YheD family protein [Cohnella faecalis]RIE04938.1 YheC/YheD family protein [Cohnella faecalis]
MPVIYPDSDAFIRETDKAPALGILVCEKNALPPFAESRFIRKLGEHGSRQGLSVFAFAPWTWNPADGTVQGWRFEPSLLKWQREAHPLPALVYDRSWPANESEKRKYRQALRKLNSARRLAHLNGPLPGKAAVQLALAGDERLSPYLPPTRLYEGTDSFLRWLTRNRGAAFLKPAAGSQGRRVVAVRRKADGSVSLRGRLADNRAFSCDCADFHEAAARIGRWIGGREYVMQPLLDLRNAKDEPFDIRALVQKNGKGRWALTGTAIRRGQAETVTANLHGGGTAEPAQAALASMFGGEKAVMLLEEIRECCLHVVCTLEQCYGRFAELGLDFGVDRSGRLWFLEANSKPGRAAMECFGEAVARTAAGRPVSYARHILFRSPGRVIHEFDHL